MLTYGSLFAGYGGLEMGVRSVLGGEVSWFAEFDKAPSAIMAHHHPGVPNLGDVTKVDWHSVPKVDVITGGSPCQDLSHAGKRAGMKAGTRSGLWASMCDAIDIIRPRLVAWENVRGALSAEADSALEPCAGCVGDGDDGPVLRALGRVLGDLAELGYDANWYGLRAADVGAPHGRFRIFLFATPANADIHGLEGIGRLRPVGRHAHGLHREGQAPALTLPPTPAVNDMGAAYTPETWDEWTARMKSTHGNGNGHGKSLAIEAQRLLPTPRTSDTNGAGHHGEGGMDLRTAAALLPTPRATRGGSGTETRDLLLPTPRATDGTKGGPNQRGSSGDLMLPSAVGRLLPTPTAADHKASGGSSPSDVTLTDAVVRTDFDRTQNARHGGLNGNTSEAVAGQDVPSLRDDLQPEALREDAGGLGSLSGADLLQPVLRQQPSDDSGELPPLEGATGSETEGVRGLRGDVAAPRPSQGPGCHQQHAGEPGGAVCELPPEAPLARGSRRPDGIDFGPYTAAIQRWEQVLGRPCPAPTEPNAKGSHRLSPVFVEFLMGLPAGHVTDPVIGISRNDQLKALGNGVVPQQCAAATRAFIQDIAKEAAA